MSNQPTDVTATETTDSTEVQPEAQRPTETVDFWKQKAREQEKRAKDNAAAAQRLAEIEEAQKSETEKTADRIAKADAEVASIPSKVADALREHLVTLHGIDKDDAELFLTSKDPDLLLKQVTRLLGQTDKRRKNGNHVPREGNNPQPGGNDTERTFVRELFGRANSD